MSNKNAGSYNKPVYGKKGLYDFTHSMMGRDLSIPTYKYKMGKSKKVFKKGSKKGYKKGYKKGKSKYGKKKYYKKTMTHGLMLGFRPIDDVPPSIYRRNCKPGSYRFLEMMFKSSPEDMLHNLAAYCQRMKAYKALDMIAVIHTRMPYQRYNQCSQAVQESCRQMWAVCQNYIIEHKCKILDPVQRSEYRILKLAEMAKKQATLAEEIEAKLKALGLRFTGNLVSLRPTTGMAEGGFASASMNLGHDMDS